MHINLAFVLNDIINYPDYFFNTIFCDPPYNLGSAWTIGENGKPFIKEAKDFMNRWEGLTHEDLEQFFKESFRVLKYGGYAIMYGIDRQLFPIQYYAKLAGFEICQSLYWYFILCSDAETEILTKRGWLKYDELLKSDIVLTMNTDNETSGWQPIKEIFTYNVKDIEMIQIENQTLSQCVTMNHRLLRQNKSNPRYNYNDWHYIEAQDLFNTKNPLSRFPSSFPCYDEGGDKEFDNPLWWELIGIILTDGYYQKGDNSIKISQSSSKQKNADRIQFLFDELQINFKTYHRDRVYEYKDTKKEYIEYIWYFNEKESIKIKEMFPNKIPTWDILSLSFENRQALFKGMLLGDRGFSNGSNLEDLLKYKGSCSFSKNNITEHYFQALAQSLGYRTIYSCNGVEEKPVVYVSAKHTSEIQNSNYLRKLKYTGVVWSIAVDNTNYCIRRNGKVSFTGNSFPKATDAGKMIDKRLGAEREVVGKKTGRSSKPILDIRGGNFGNSKSGRIDCSDITAPASPLAKTFDGYKYSITPFKQTVETIMVFKKPTKNKSVLDDLFAWSEGDTEISPSVINIDGGRVSISQKDFNILEAKSSKKPTTNYSDKKDKIYSAFAEDRASRPHTKGRYPAQTFLDKDTAKIIDRQSGNRKGWSGQNHNEFNPYGGNALNKSATERKGHFEGFKDSGGASRICHTCTYEQEEIDLFFYSPKVSNKERNAGLEKFEEKEGDRTTGKHLSNYIRRCPKHDKPIPSGGSTYTCGCEFQYDNNIIVKPVKNNHPTLKPLSLNKHIMTLFKLPDEVNQKVYIPFTGTFSEVIGAVKASIKEENIYGCEIEKYWIDIGEARLIYWRNRPLQNEQKIEDKNQLKLFK